MSLDFRRALVRRLDALLLASLLVTSGAAGVLFATRFYNGGESTVTPAAAAPTPTQANVTRASAPPPLVTPLALAETYAGQPLTVHGAAQPADIIQLYDNGELIAMAVADSTGAWSLTLPGGLNEGSHALSVVAVSEDGAVSQTVAVAFLVAGPPTATPSPAISPSSTPTFTATPSPTPTV
ncbi:MAG: Ig-like domain-containing protein, partial [Aggregatilineaceae bacterium]